MMTRERELPQQALDALDRAISDDRAYIRECKDAAEVIRAHLAAQPAPAEDFCYCDEDFCYCDDDISLQMVSGGAALEGLYGRVTLKINGQYVDYVKAQPAPAEPVALESVHLTRDIKGMCTVRVNGRVAIQDNGDIIDHMATLEWFAQPAPVPLTEGRITAIANELAFGGGHCNVYELARAIEAAHGITGGSK